MDSSSKRMAAVFAIRILLSNNQILCIYRNKPGYKHKTRYYDIHKVIYTGILM